MNIQRPSLHSLLFVTGCVFAFLFAANLPVTAAMSASGQEKFSLWKKPSFFRGAAIHPYNPYYDGVKIFSFVTKEDFASLRNQGANVVSLNYPGPYRADPPYALDPIKLKWLDDAVGWAEEVGLYVVIHFRNGPGKSEATFAGSPDGADEILWYSQTAKDKWVDMWRFVADRYKNRTHVVAYNLMVEPHPDVPVKQPPLPASVWFDLAKQITKGIREVDTQTPIIVPATTWSNPLAMEDAVPTGDARTIYSFHMYEPFDFTHQGFDWAGKGNISGLVYPGKIPSDIYPETMYWDKNRLRDVMKHALAFQTKYQTPIFIGEFGCNRRVQSCIVFLDDLLSIFEEYGWSYTHFVWRDGAESGAGGGDFDYETEPTGTAPVLESSYMRMFKKHWKAAETISPAPGSLIKQTCPSGATAAHPCKAVYYYGQNGKRFVFPNFMTFTTWYPDFTTIKTISPETLSSIPLGGNVTYRPAVKLVKITTDPKVYAVAVGGVLRWVRTEALAISLYGTDWNQKIDDVPDAFFVNYSVGADITTVSDFSPAAELAAASSINY
ncbi:glycoside hydrolase family 5 protein [Patescibacteria group bacterium]|nr:MAG: glycoside hydrolase family 5 protein [Patescibacteria group bacterium]